MEVVDGDGLFSCRIVPLVCFYRRASCDSERVEQILGGPSGALVGEKKNFKLIVFFPLYGGTLCYIGPPGPCQGPSGEEKNFENGH